jgi:hypothetical protein
MRRAILALVLVALVACGKAGTGGSSPDSGIEGKVLLGPQCPVEPLETPCPDKPFEADIEVVDRSGDVVATAHSGQDGRFSVRVEPGSYVLKPQAPKQNGFPFGKDVAVSVRAHHFTRVTVTFDTGIR